jgi:hypothetical protein
MTNDADIQRIRSKVRDLIAALPPKLRAELPLDLEDGGSAGSGPSAPRSYLKVRGHGAAAHKRNASQITASSSDDRMHLATVPSVMPSNAVTSPKGGPLIRSVSDNDAAKANANANANSPTPTSPRSGDGAGHKPKTKSFHQMFVEKQYGGGVAPRSNANANTPAAAATPTSPNAPGQAPGPAGSPAPARVATIPEDGGSMHSNHSGTNSLPRMGAKTPERKSADPSTLGLSTVPSPMSPRSKGALIFSVVLRFQRTSHLCPC